MEHPEFATLVTNQQLIDYKNAIYSSALSTYGTQFSKVDKTIMLFKQHELFIEVERMKLHSEFRIFEFAFE